MAIEITICIAHTNNVNIINALKSDCFPPDLIYPPGIAIQAIPISSRTAIPNAKTPISAGVNSRENPHWQIKLNAKKKYIDKPDHKLALINLSLIVMFDIFFRVLAQSNELNAQLAHPMLMI